MGCCCLVNDVGLMSLAKVTELTSFIIAECVQVTELVLTAMKNGLPQLQTFDYRGEYTGVSDGGDYDA